MNGFGIYPDDDILKFFCEKGKVDNLRGRVVDINSIPVTIPVIGTPERNNNFHIAMKNALVNHTMRTLISESEMRDILEEDVEYLLSNSEKKSDILLGNVQIDCMISEAIKLEQVIKKGFISLKEPNTVGATKDRIVATEYANYFFHLKELEMEKRKKKKNIDFDNFRLTF